MELRCKNVLSKGHNLLALSKIFQINMKAQPTEKSVHGHEMFK